MKHPFFIRDAFFLLIRFYYFFYILLNEDQTLKQEISLDLQTDFNLIYYGTA